MRECSKTGRFGSRKKACVCGRFSWNIKKNKSLAARLKAARPICTFEMDDKQ